MAHPHRWRTLPIILVATFMYGFDFNVVNVALPSIQRDLDADSVALELIVGGYAFTYAAGLVVGGRLGDLFGYGRLFSVGMAAFTVTSLGCALAQTPAELVVARMLQGLAAALMVPQVLALITALFPPVERPRALAWFGVTAGVSGLAGQVLGGLLVTANIFDLSWRAIFYLNLPIGITVLALAAGLIPRIIIEGPARLDAIGAIGVTASLALALVPIILGQQLGWPFWSWISFAASIAAMVLTLGWERRVRRRGRQPLLDLSLFRLRSFVAGLIVSVAFMAMFTSSVFVTSLLLQDGLRLNPLNAGLTFLPMALFGVIAPVIGRRIVPRLGSSLTMLIGAVLSTASLITLAAQLGSSGSSTRLVVAVTVGGLGLGNLLILPTLISTTLVDVRADQAGIASGMLNTTQQFAGAAGIAVIGTVFFGTLGAGRGQLVYAHATSAALWVDVGLTLVIAGISAYRALRRRRTGPRVTAPGRS